MLVSDLHRWILPEVLDCPDPVVDHAIVAAAFDFCDQTGAWDEVQAPQTLVAGQADYTITAPTDAIALRVRDVVVGGFVMPPIDLTDTQSGSSLRGYTSAISRGQIRLHPTPTVSGDALVVRAVYAPAMTAATLPDFLMQRHASVISAGVKARLMFMPGVAWSNPGLGATYQQQFVSGIVDARIESLHERSHGSIRIKPLFSL